MKTNSEGLQLIAFMESEYEPPESRTAAEKAVNLFVKSRINKNQFSALVCLVMFMGIDNFKRSSILKLINRGITDTNLQAISDQFYCYIYADTDTAVRVIDPFLMTQREFEKDLFLKPELIAKRKPRKLSKQRE